MRGLLLARSHDTTPPPPPRPAAPPATARTVFRRRARPGRSIAVQGVPDRHARPSCFRRLGGLGGRGPDFAPFGSAVDRAKRYLVENFENLFVLLTLLSTAVVNYLVPTKLAF